MKYNYSKLLGRMKECGFTQERLANTIGRSQNTLHNKLKGQFHFTADEMDGICRALDIPNSEIGSYFFAK